MKELSLREIQLAELEILKKFARICEEQGFRYYLFFGTLLGAVRHQGFIPWDDDVDVMMPRGDYERFLAYCAEQAASLKPYRIMHWTTNEQYIYPIARFCDTRYQVDYDNAADYGLGLFVDIYPFDGSGDMAEVAQRIYATSAIKADLIYQAGTTRFEKSSSGNPIRTCIKFIEYGVAKCLGARRLIISAEKMAKRRPFEDSKYIQCVVWPGYRCKLFEREKMEKDAVLRFEDADFRVPADYDHVLSVCYGDYMKLPPESEQIAHHYYKAYLKSES